MNVVLLCRVSTNHQDYHRQIAELTEFSNHQGWKIEKVFANKISGAKKVEERPEIQEMMHAYFDSSLLAQPHVEYAEEPLAELGRLRFCEDFDKSHYNFTLYKDARHNVQRKQFSITLLGCSLSYTKGAFFSLHPFESDSFG